MMQEPPLPPGLSFQRPQGEPPLPPGLSFEPPRQRQNAARPAPSRPAPVAAPRQQSVAAPAASGGQMTDLGISADDEITALVRQGYSMDQARQMASEPEVVGYGVVDRQDLAPTDTPESLAAQGYEFDPQANVYARVVGRTQAPGTAQPQQTPAPSAGYQQAYEIARRNADLAAQAGGGVDFTDQLTAPFNDELSWGAGYVSQSLGNLGRRLMGRDIEVSALEAARATRDVANADQERFAAENPGQAFAGQLLGGFAFAPARVAGIVNAPSQFLRTSNAFVRPSRFANYAATAGTGAAYGAADADGGVGDRALGAGIGAVGSLATAGAIDTAQAGIRQAIAARQGPRLTGQEARVGNVINRELRANRVDSNDLLQSINAAPAGSLPFNAADGVLAPVAEALVASTGPGGRTVRQAVDAQRGAAPDRIMGRIGQELGGQGDYFATLNRTIETRRAEAGQVIDRIGPQQFRLNDNTVRALRSDLAQPTLREAAQNALASPDQATYEMGANIMRLADTLRDNPAAAVLDVRTAQDVSRALLDMSSDAWQAGNGSRGRALGQIGQALRQNARDAVPEYRQWLSRYGDDSSQIEALELGRRIFRNADDPAADGMSAEVLRSQFNEMSDTAKDMFRKGVAEAIVARARTSRGGVGAMRDLLRTQEFGDRIRLAFPNEQAFTRFMNAAEAEVGMANLGQQVTQNSRTAARQETLRRLNVQPEADAAERLSGATLTGLPLEGARLGLRAAGRTLGRSRSVIENEDLNALLGRAITDPEVLRALLQRPSRRVGLIGGGRAPVGLVGAGTSALIP